MLKVVLTSVYRDELAAGGPETATAPFGLAATQAEQIATQLVTRTASNGKLLANVADLVGRYVSGAAPDSLYDGFSADDLSGGVAGPGNIVQRFREASIRALSADGTAGTWNLLIDVVAQTGRYPLGSTALPNFLVEGEQRYWVHVAIDRESGTVIDRQFEQVTE